MPITLLGLGNMGDGIARTLLSRGQAVSVWNRTPARALAFADSGARIARTVAEAVAGAEVVLTILADDAAVKAVVEGSGGLLATMPRGTVHASLSTISVELARKLAAAHAALGQGFVSAPVFGRPAAAQAGQLLVVAAGPSDAVEKARPALEAVGRQLVVVGSDAGQANAVKLGGNFLIASMIESLGEAFALVRRHGVEAARFLEVVNGGLFKSPVYDTYGTLIAEESFSPPGFALPLGLKDIRLVLAAADAAGVPMPAASLLHDHLLAALARGKGDLDWSALGALIAEDAGLPSSSVADGRR
jgi:3-hydroxyisobutyrate dehydrogenase-like beta-hydroxyacid dehydrogenase